MTAFAVITGTGVAGSVTVHCLARVTTSHQPLATSH